jgi:hypothetical protein
LDRVVDLWAAWYAATMMFVGLFLLGLLVSVVSGAAGVYVAPYVLGAACLIGAGLGYVVFRKVAEGLVFDPSDNTIEIPASRPYESILDLLSFAKYRQLMRRERIGLASIHALGERDVALRDSRKRLAGYAYYLDVEGSFGAHAIHFRSDEKRREARAFIERLRRSTR